MNRRPPPGPPQPAYESKAKQPDTAGSAKPLRAITASIQAKPAATWPEPSTQGRLPATVRPITQAAPSVKMHAPPPRPTNFAAAQAKLLTPTLPPRLAAPAPKPPSPPTKLVAPPPPTVGMVRSAQAKNSTVPGHPRRTYARIRNIIQPMFDGILNLNSQNFYTPPADDTLSVMTEPDTDEMISIIERKKTKKKNLKRVFFNKSKKEWLGNKNIIDWVDDIFNFAKNNKIQLVEDSKAIQKAGEDSGSQGVTVVCTLSLKTKETYKTPRYVKLCYTNLGDAIPVDLHKMAVQMGYQLIKGSQMHAEAAAIVHHKSYSKTYQLVAMGCDKDHCPECSTLMARSLLKIQKKATVGKKKTKKDVQEVQYNIIPTFSNLTSGADNTFPNYHLFSQYFKKTLEMEPGVNRPKEETNFQTFNHVNFSTLKGFK